MKKILVLLLVLFCAFAVFADDETSDIQDVINGFSYYVGAQSFMSNNQYYYGLDPNYFAMGAVDVANGTFQLSSEQIEGYVNAFAQYYQAITNQLAELAAENLEAAESFLKTNKNKVGVVTTNSGLQYKVTKKGVGKKANANNTVSVYYTLTLLDGTVVDQCVAPAKAAEFSLDSVVPGFAEACMVAPVGSKLTAWVHPDLGYKDSITGGIDPNSLLIFDIEIVAVK